MNKVIATLILCLLTKFAIASDFVGKWQVYKVDMPETYYGEIKYPKYFEITENEGEVSGYYKDQFDFVTYGQVFVWQASQVDSLPLTIPSN